MALVRNLGKADRTLRIVMGAVLDALAVLVQAPLCGAVLLGHAGFVILLEGVIGH